MKIGLIDIEPKIINTAYMQISRYHKDQGDTVEWWQPLYSDEFDHVYCASLFNFTDKAGVPADAICGGTGFDIKSKLSKEIENCDYDYSLYPECDFSIVWFSRGCIRNCPFCVVQQKEGGIMPVSPKKLNPKGQYIVVQDNNFFASPEWVNAIFQLKDTKQPISFNGGIDARIMDKEKSEALTQLILHKQIYMAWDNPKDDLISQFKLMTKYIKPYKLACYVLIGYWSTPKEDLYRVETLRDLKIDPFAMPYNKKDYYQKRFARWVNMKSIFKSVAWKDYRG